MRIKIVTIILTVLIFLSAVTLGVSAVYRVNEVTVSAVTVSEEAKTEAVAFRLRLGES